MKEIDLTRLFENKDLLQSRIDEYEKKELIQKVPISKTEIQGHLEKAKHNLSFVKDIQKMQYPDWCLTGCYSAVYHAAMALLIAKGFFSKNHDASLCLLIKEYFPSGIVAADVELLNQFYLDYQDILFYVQSKNKREEASYATSYKFEKPLVEELRLKAILFIDKVKNILGEK